MITSVLVANRGEIARRVFRTCAELGIATVAVHSDADADAPHVREADAAVRLPGVTPSETYLRGDLVVEAALAAGADAVHPGYGFLSENAEFARAVQGAGLTWIGPPPDAVAAMASKTRAKQLMGEAGVPLLAAVQPRDVTDADLPLLVKAAAGGGGRGMRVVRELAALEGEMNAASAEAAAAFGDGEVFAEPYVERGRHVEVQVLADRHGTVWALGTRDCSLQRRHQKVVEEAPAPALGDELRGTLHEAAVRAARAVGYRGAGTVEFLVPADAADGDRARAYFLEMNTRLQVEHPVTELVHGVDLVAWQIRIAEGEPLDPDGPPPARGHAVEARLYAEDPARGWQPQTGTLHRLEVPGVRLDSGVAPGDEIGTHYDPMLAKAAAWAPTRREALRKLAHALERAQVHGPATNRDLLVRSLRHPEFTGSGPAAEDPGAGGDAGRGALPGLDTGFYERHLPELAASPGGSRGVRLAALAAAVEDAAGRREAGATVTARLGGWRNVPSQPQVKTYRSEPARQEVEVRYRLTRDGLQVDDMPGGDGPSGAAEDGPGRARLRLLHAGPGRVSLEVDGVRRDFTVARYGPGGERVHVDAPPPLGSHTLTALPRLREPRAAEEPGSLLAPMPGTVARVVPGLAVGAAVRAGEPLLWLEAMKMEHKVLAPVTGTLTALHAEAGAQVDVGALLAVVAEDAGTGAASDPHEADPRNGVPDTAPAGAARAQSAPQSAPQSDSAPHDPSGTSAT